MESTSGRATSLTGPVLASLRRNLTESEPYQRFLYRVAAVFAASVLLHAVVFVADDRPWISPGSWRQPLAFSFGFVLVLPSLAWAMNFLPRRRRLGWALSATLGVAALWEVFLIALQAWRGQPAFFPEEDLQFDQAVWMGMQIGIGFIVVAIVVETVWAFISLRAPSSFRWAIWTGLVLMVAGLAMGGLMVAEGIRQEELGPVDSPIVFGRAGLVIFPHLLALFGLLVFSVLAWLLSFAALPERRRTGVLELAIAGYVALVAVSLAQALQGRAPFDLTGFTAALFWISAALFVGAAVVTFILLRRAAQGPRVSG